MSKILIVDDSEIVRNQIVAAITSAGYEIVTAVDGRDGVNQFNANPDVNLVISDINMPNLSGLEMIEEIRKHEKGKDVLIFVLTTEASPELKTRGKDLGVKGWIVKPFNPANLLAGVKKMLG